LEERILVVPRAKLFAGMETPQGFGAEGLKQLVERVRDFHEFADRRAAEEDPSLKQIIPYMVLVSGPKAFLMRRFDNQDEERLRNLYSLGVGGHINPAEDAGESDILMAGLKRELGEEVAIAGSFELEPVGYINDETNAVGQVHFGLAYRVMVQGEAAEVREKDIMSGSFATVEELQSAYPEMETWSQIVFRNIDAFVPEASEPGGE
jgi:predicted NUDIX family phosphoesterase